MDHDELNRKNRELWMNCTDTDIFNMKDYYEKNAKILHVLARHYLAPDMRVADIACGNGAYTKLLSDYCARITGFELSDSLRDVASREYPLANGEYLPLDLEDESWAIDDEYGAIFCMGVLVYLHTPPLFKNTLRKFYDLLKPGGSLITRDTVSKGKTLRVHHHNGSYATYRSRSSFIGGFEKAGFTLERRIEMYTRIDKNNAFYVFRKPD